MEVGGVHVAVGEHDLLGEHREGGDDARLAGAALAADHDQLRHRDVDHPAPTTGSDQGGAAWHLSLRAAGTSDRRRPRDRTAAVGAMAGYVRPARRKSERISGGIDQRETAGIGLGDATVVGDLEEDLETFVGAVLVHPIVSRAGPVDDHAERDPEHPHRLDRQLEVVEPEGRRLGDQNHEVAPRTAAIIGARRAGRRVDEDHPVGVGRGPDRTDQRRDQGLAHVETPVNEVDTRRPVPLDHADGSHRFGDGLLRAHQGAAAAAVAEFGENQTPVPGSRWRCTDRSGCTRRTDAAFGSTRNRNAAVFEPRSAARRKR